MSLAQAMAQRLQPRLQLGLGDYFAGFIDEEAQKQGTTAEALNGMRLGLLATS